MVEEGVISPLFCLVGTVTGTGRPLPLRMRDKGEEEEEEEEEEGGGEGGRGRITLPRGRMGVVEAVPVRIMEEGRGRRGR